MAEAKTTTKVKKSAKKTDIKKDAAKAKKATADLMKDLRSLTNAELNKALVEAKDDLKKAQKMLKATKIARIHTVMTEQENEQTNEEAK